MVNFVEIHNFFFETLGTRLVLELEMFIFFGVVLVIYVLYWKH